MNVTLGSKSLRITTDLIENDVFLKEYVALIWALLVYAREGIWAYCEAAAASECERRPMDG